MSTMREQCAPSKGKGDPLLGTNIVSACGHWGGKTVPLTLWKTGDVESGELERGHGKTQKVFLPHPTFTRAASR